MNVSVDNHPLALDFPELKDRIHTLKTTDAHFARLHKEYEEVDRAVIRLETGVEHGPDAELEAGKRRRVQLKDALYALLKG